MAPINHVIVRKILVVGVFAAALVLVYTVVTDVRIRLSTGVLKADTSLKEAVITVSQASSEAKIIGRQSTNIRLKPGDYYVLASGSGEQAGTVVHVLKNQTKEVHLNPAPPTATDNPISADFISYKGFDELQLKGVSKTQIDDMKRLLLSYKPNSHSMTISNIQNMSWQNYPNNTGGWQTTTFDISLDTTALKGSIYYDSVGAIVDLTLTDAANGQKVFSESNKQYYTS